MKPSSVKHTFLRLIILFILLINNFVAYSQSKEVVKQESSQLTDVLNYTAKDSMILDMENNKSFLYNEAHIDYGEISLDACFIEFDLKTKIVIARYCLDSNNNKIGIPVIKDGETATKSDSLKYNFETQKGITYHVKLKEGESYIHGEKVKKQTNGDIHIKNALYTTCDLDHPHFYFKLSKAIIKPDDKIVSGPVNLFIADIPTPLGLPFAFLPNKKNKSSNGLIVPTYGESAALGFYLLGGGYYHQFKSGKFSTSLTGDIYSKGSWGVSNRTQYKARYKYSGQFSLNYRNTIQGEKGFEDYSKSKDFFVKWNHQNDTKLNPGTTFRALINAGTSTNFRNDYNNISASNYLTNTFNSNISWSKQFKRKISSNLNGNLRHSQNSNTGMMTFTLPEIAYNVNRFYPLKMLRKTTISKNFIHEFINQTNVNYQLNTKNEINELSEDIKLENFNNMLVNSRKGIRHNINASSSIKLLGKNITINPAYQLSSLWYFDQINKSWNTTNKEVQNDTIRDFSSIYSHSFSASATSKIYGFYQPAKFLRGKHEMKIRHTITPNVNFSYKPSTYNLDKYQNDSTGNNFTNYSPYSNNIYGTVSANESGRIGFSLINSLELKRKNINDTTIKDEFIKSKILDNFSINSGYDIMKDSFNLDRINLVGRTNLWKKVNIRFAGSLDPYRYINGTRVNQYQFKNGKIGTLTNANLAIGMNLKSKKSAKKTYTSNKGSNEELDFINSNSDLYIDFNIPWTLNIDYKIDYRRTISSEIDTSYITQSVGLRGDLSLTKNWKISYMTNFDFVNKEFSFTSINIARDLHCWQMGFNWIPFGFMRSYNIQINVKSSLLQDLKLQRRRTWYDNNLF